jgi:rare lipoprotein A
MDGNTTMKPRAVLAAAALLALAGAIGPTGSKLRAAEGAAASAAAPTQETIDADLPRFEPSTEEFAEGFAAFEADASQIATIQPIPAIEDEAEAEAREIGGGVASWYGREFAGHRTASGERFDPSGYTAAHRTLPFGSKVRVTRGGKSVVVRINDRGPFHGGRVIDLSQAAASELGLVNAGSGKVTLALIAD